MINRGTAVSLAGRAAAAWGSARLVLGASEMPPKRGQRRATTTKLHIAAHKGHGEIVSGLVAAGADVNAAMQDGSTTTE